MDTWPGSLEMPYLVDYPVLFDMVQSPIIPFL